MQLSSASDRSRRRSTRRSPFRSVVDAFAIIGIICVGAVTAVPARRRYQSLSLVLVIAILVGGYRFFPAGASEPVLIAQAQMTPEPETPAVATPAVEASPKAARGADPDIQVSRERPGITTRGDRPGDGGEAPASAEQPRPRGILTYEVAIGDSIVVIADKFGVTPATVIYANKLKDAEQITVGEKLLIPPVTGALHTIAEGESLVAVASRYKVTPETILRFNYLADPALIQIGQKLAIPLPADTSEWPVAATGRVIAPAAAAVEEEDDTPSRLVRLAVPFRTQFDGSAYQGGNCGPASLAMVLAAFGKVVPTGDLRAIVNDLQGTWRIYDSGTAIDNLATIARRHGLQPTLRRWTLDDVRDQLRAGQPLIPQVRYRALPGRAGSRYGGDHYIVITGFDGDEFIYNDPASDIYPGHQRRMSARTLLNAWSTSSYPMGAVAVGGGGKSLRGR
ncbi:MAG: LysM peptidoglycan-binding domain-containing protein [Chloroflexi bacterium]|nr:LysM peptidoglycan-binding domain-containing protein [Chloroflexota bacterium]